MPDGELKLGPQRRDLAASDLAVRRATPESKRVDLSFSASSESPVERFYGTEILSHAEGAIRLARVKAGAVPLLFNHDWSDPVGMVDAARLAAGRLAVDAHLFETARAQEIATMVDGGLRNVSIGYQVHEMEEVKKSSTFVARDWEPLEISIVTVPADASIGIGRAGDEQATPVRIVRASESPAVPAITTGAIMAEVTNAPAGAPADVSLGTDYGAQERLRIKTLQMLARNHNIPADTVDAWVDSGMSGDEAAHKCLEIIAERAKRSVKDSPASLGMSAKDVRQYSVTRAIKACVEKSWAAVAPYEAELSKAVAARIGKQTGEHTFYVPLDVQWAASQQRDLIVGTSTMGGYLVGTNVMSFIDLLRNRSVVMRLGATTMPGLQGSVSIPKQVTAATAHWFANEAGTATESNITFGQVALTPKTVSGYVEISRQLLLQSTPNAEGVVNADLARVIGLAVDSAAIAGPGTAGQPTGITATSGVGTANPATGTAVTYADMIRFQTVVAGSNAFMPGFAYVTTPTVAGFLMAKSRFTNSDTPIWGGNILDGALVGARAMSTLQVGSGTMLAGDFSQVVVGEWGVLEIEANPYAQFQSGIVGVRALYTCDVGVRYGPAFALGTGLVS